MFCGHLRTQALRPRAAKARGQGEQADYWALLGPAPLPPVESGQPQGLGCLRADTQAMATGHHRAPLGTWTRTAGRDRAWGLMCRPLAWVLGGSGGAPSHDTVPKHMGTPHRGWEG